MMDKRERSLRAISWALVNGAFLTIGYLGYFRETQWALNVFRFYFWLTVVAATFVAFNKDLQESKRKKGPTVPIWLDATLDAGIATVLAALGHFVMAGFWLWQLGVIQIVHRKEDKPCVAS